MPSEQPFDLINANRLQLVSERDSFTPARYRQMQSHFPEHAKVILDVGCNTGRGGIVLKTINPAYELTGLDCVPERLAALDRTVYLRTICGFSNEIPVGNKSFDAIVGGEFIEHVPPSQIDATLAEFFRILRLKGRLLLTTPNPNYLKNKVKGLSVLLDDSHLTQHYPDALAHRMRLTGYSRISIFGSGRVSVFLGQRFPWLPVYGSYLIQGDKW
jgi:ubiquinone/menaquinone biosynthesis C-methylase UbiE